MSSFGIGFIDPNKNIKWFSEKEGILGNTTSVISTISGKIYASSDKGLFSLTGDKFEHLNYNKSWDRTFSFFQAFQMQPSRIRHVKRKQSVPCTELGTINLK